ncbi:MAG: hypothetical protein Q4G34_08695, partial [Micrococcus sp.]|nr:hypothetical protein [Micrococcus sp.]
MTQTPETSEDPLPPTGRPMPVILASLALGLLTVAMGIITVNGALSIGQGALNLGGQIFLVVMYAALTAWLAMTALGLWRARSWSRAAATAIFLFAVLLSTWMISGGDLWLGLGLAAVSAVGLIGVMSRAVSQHLTPRG